MISTAIAIFGMGSVVLGSMGAIAYRNVQSIITYNVIIAVGLLGIGIATANETGLAGAIYYLVHDMIVKTLLFLVVGTLVTITSTSHLQKMGGVIHDYPWLAWTFFLTSLSLVGVPPLSGFVGKLAILQGTVEAGMYTLFAFGLLSSLAVLYSLTNIFIHGFWGEERVDYGEEPRTNPKLGAPLVILTLTMMALGIGADYIYPVSLQASQELFAPHTYVDAVFNSHP